MKNEFQVIAELIEKEKKVLDVGCGDGTLMKYLKDMDDETFENYNIPSNKIISIIFDENMNLSSENFFSY